MRSKTRLWPNAGLLSAQRLRRWANISPVLGYRVLYDATLHVGQRHRRRANINPAFVQSIVRVLQPAWSRLTDYGWMDTSQHRRRCPTFTRHWFGVGWHCIANTRRWTSDGFMLGQRRRRWANINPALVQSIMPVPLGQRRGRWASIGPAMGQRFVFAGSVDKLHCVVFRTKTNNQFCPIGLPSLSCPQEPFNNINYKSHWRLLAINLYGYADGGETSSVFCLRETVTLLVCIWLTLIISFNNLCYYIIHIIMNNYGNNS